MDQRYDLWAIFGLGLTTGGLSCLVVQAGLLASVMARRITVSSASSQEKPITALQLLDDPWPVVYFLAAKVSAYTVLGFLLGALGSWLEITPPVQGFMQVVAGVFMVGTALNLLNVHPIFRYFALQPPASFSRLVRNQAKSEEMFAPALLGFVTVLVPCGTTQAMEVLAISSGSPIMGAMILLNFTLGSSATFYVVAVLVTKLRGKVERLSTLVAAMLILILGMLSLDAGLNLLGSPITPRTIVTASLQSSSSANTAAQTPAPLLGNPGQSLVFGASASIDFDAPPPGVTPAAATQVNGVQEVIIQTLDNGYEPAYWTVKSGQPIRLRLRTNNTFGCTRAFVIPSQSIQQILPETGETVIDLPAQKPGALRFTCGMGMYRGVISVS